MGALNTARTSFAEPSLITEPTGTEKATLVKFLSVIFECYFAYIATEGTISQGFNSTKRMSFLLFVLREIPFNLSHNCPNLICKYAINYSFMTETSRSRSQDKCYCAICK